ncbi:MAG: photosynthetic reaction center cytochrome PufC, partial [Anderseniella sp.]
MKIPIYGYILGAVTIMLTIPMMMTWEAPPMDTTQVGYRGTGMELISNPRLVAKNVAAFQIPEAQEPAEKSGEKASSVYENVPVLGDLDQAEFDRLMLAITEWVAPEAGCTYCHSENNLAEDTKYTKIVARRMLQMTKTINADWGQSHAQPTGVTCYTCHRGQPVPAETWSINPGLPEYGGIAASKMGQNLASKEVGTTSLPYDPFTDLLGKEGNIRVAATTALPQGTSIASIQDTEKTYGLMMHMSQSLGANCTFCHNTRNFSDWTQSPETRVKAWHGIKMVNQINQNYMDPLASVFPDNRKGPEGDVLKVNCATCHVGA